MVTQRTYACQSFGLSIYWNMNAMTPRTKKLDGTMILGSALSLTKPKTGATIKIEMRAPVTTRM